MCYYIGRQVFQDGSYQRQGGNKEGMDSIAQN